MEVVTRVEDEFKRHADQFDVHYADRMSAAIAAEHPAAAAAAAKQPCNGGC